LGHLALSPVGGGFFGPAAGYSGLNPGRGSRAHGKPGITQTHECHSRRRSNDGAAAFSVKYVRNERMVSSNYVTSCLIALHANFKIVFAIPLRAVRSR
jgi:hypothetical protein